MSIATTAEQSAVAHSIGSWARSADPIAAVRSGALGSTWSGIADLGLFSVALAEDVGGAGGSVVDLAVMLEEAAARLVPGPLLSTCLAGLIVGRSAVAKRFAPDIAEGRLPCAVVIDDQVFTGASESDAIVVHGSASGVLGASHGAAVLLPVSVDDSVVWCLVEGAAVEPAAVLDISAPIGTVVCEQIRVPAEHIVPGVRAGLVRDLAATLAAAEAAGVAGWCLNTAVEYAKVREQFGAKIGSFQAIKHLCAEMLCRAERARAVAWDAAVAADTDAELPIAAAVAAAVASEAAVANAKDCIQVLGGIGFTWEHDAHLYLRRATALRQLLAGSSIWRRRVAELTRAGSRRGSAIELGDVESRAPIRANVAAIAALPTDRQRNALVDNGFLTPSWPKPYGRDATIAEQIVISEELEAAGIELPDLVIGRWAVPTILAHGTPAQIERFVEPTLRGEIEWCQLFSEPGAGSDLAALRTGATRTDGGWQLQGQKVWTSRAQYAHWGICLARTNPDAPKHRGITYFVVDMTAPGVTIRPLREITGEERFNEVFLDGVFVPDDCVVGVVDGGWRLAHTTLANERVAMGRGSLLGTTMEQLIASIPADDPVLDDRLGGLICDAVAGSLLDVRAVLRQLDGKDPGAESSVSKLVGVRHRMDVAEFALETAGLAGALDSAQTNAFLVTRCLSIAGGTTQILLSVAAERILGLPRS